MSTPIQDLNKLCSPDAEAMADGERLTALIKAINSYRVDVQKTANQIGECIEYCAVQNGIPECKNCGLTLKMYQTLINLNKS